MDGWSSGWAWWLGGPGPSSLASERLLTARLLCRSSPRRVSWRRHGGISAEAVTHKRTRWGGGGATRQMRLGGYALNTTGSCETSSWLFPSLRVWKMRVAAPSLRELG